MTTVAGLWAIFELIGYRQLIVWLAVDSMGVVVVLFFDLTRRVMSICRLLNVDLSKYTFKNFQ